MTSLLDDVKPRSLQGLIEGTPRQWRARFLHTPEGGHDLRLEIGGSLERISEQSAGVLLHPSDELALARLRIDPTLSEHEDRHASTPGHDELFLRGGEASVEHRLPIMGAEQQEVDVGVLDAAKADLPGWECLRCEVLEPVGLVTEREDEPGERVAFLLQASANR